MAANYGLSRKVGVIFEKGALADTVMFMQAGTVTDPSIAFSKPAVTLLKAQSRIMAPISTNLRYSIDDMEASVTYYDENGLPNEPVPVVTRAGEDEGEEGDDGPQAQPSHPGSPMFRLRTRAFSSKPRRMKQASSAGPT